MSRQIRYIRDYLNGNSRESPGSVGRAGGDGAYPANLPIGFNGCQWVQIAAWDAGRPNDNINNATSNGAYLAGVTANFAPSLGALARVTNGNSSSDSFVGGTAVGSPLWVQVDLGAPRNIESVQVWHRYDDSRIYFGHALWVSLDGVAWKTIIGGEGDVVEKSTGAFYHLFSAVDETVRFDAAYIAKIKTAINASRTKRGRPAYTFAATVSQFATKVQPVQLADLRSGLSDLIRTPPASPSASDITWTQSTTDNLGRIEKQDFNEVIVNYSRHLNSAQCASGCIQECAAVCASTCGQSACSYLCGSSCQGTCATNCGNACATGCYAACKVGCGGACAAGCGGNCATNACKPVCMYSCEGGCVGGCQGQIFFPTWCLGGCNVQCYGNCQYLCGTTCSDGCSSACAGGCTDSCHIGCGAGCNTRCGALCTVACGTGCEMMCGGGCQNACGDTCKASCQALCSAETCAHGCVAAASGMDYNATTT